MKSKLVISKQNVHMVEVGEGGPGTRAGSRIGSEMGGSVSKNAPSVMASSSIDKTQKSSKS